MKVSLSFAAFLLGVVPARAGYFDRSFRLSDPYDLFFGPPRARAEQEDRRLPPPPSLSREGGECSRRFCPMHPDQQQQELLESNNATLSIPPQQAGNTTPPPSKAAAAATPMTSKKDVAAPKFHGAAFMAFCNILLFALRPDPDVTWPARVPRIVWELVVWWNLRRASWQRGGSDVLLSSPFYFWLAFLTGSTGFVDLFIWAPLYGAFVNFQTCEGGWLQPKACRLDPWKGYGRLAVAVQSVLGGMVYLNTALRALHAMHLKRVEYQQKQQQLQQQSLLAALPYAPPPHYRPEQQRVPYDPRDPHYRYRR